MRTKKISTIMMVCFVTVFTIFSCKEKEKNSNYSDTQIIASEPDNKNLVSNTEKESIEKPKTPVLNKLAKKYGVKSKVYTFDEVDRIPLFNASCLDTKNPTECSSDKLNDYISDNIKYPQKEISEGNEGYEIIHFVVDKNGRVANTKIVSTINNDCESCKQATIDIFNKMGTWVPAKKNGVNVAVELSVPIRFEIHNS